MTKRIGNVVIIEPEEDDICEECGKKDELRPYGEGGKRICFTCAQKDVEGTKRRMAQALFGEESN